jgi:hypothetical protein
MLQALQKVKRCWLIEIKWLPFRKSLPGFREF